jgi:hypothetical protein
MAKRWRLSHLFVKLLTVSSHALNKPDTNKNGIQVLPDPGRRRKGASRSPDTHGAEANAAGQKQQWGYDTHRPSLTRLRAVRRALDYAMLRREYLISHPYCEFPGCCDHAQQIHHKAGRRGNNFFRHWMAICDSHHKWINRNPEEARTMNLVLTEPPPPRKVRKRQSQPSS